MNKHSTLKNIYPDWLRYRKLEVSINTLEKNIRSWNRYFLFDDITDVPLPDLTRLYLKAWATDLIRRQSMTKHYFDSEIKSMLNGMLDYAVDLDVIDINKFRSVKINSRVFRPKQLKEDTEDVFTLEEERLIMREAEKDSNENLSAIPLGVCILFCTGLRVGELCALKWGDIQGHVLTVQRMQIAHKVNDNGSIRTDGYIVVEHTKTSAGYRRVFLPDKAIDYFCRIKYLNTINGFSVTAEDYVFRRDNRYVEMQHDDLANTRVFDARLRKYCRNLKLPYRKSPHDIRRTYISHLLESGLNVDTVRKLAGHENVEMTLAYCRSRVPVEQLKEDIENIFKKL